MATSGERWQELENLYHTSLGLRKEDRALFLRDACKDDELRRELESMLSVQEKSREFLEEPAFRASVLVERLRSAGPQNSQSLEGELVSHYRVLGRIGSGGMGAVYKAEDTKLHRFVALKFLTTPLGAERGVENAGAKALERFQREARAASALDHPNICVVYEVDEWNGTPFIAMQLLKGRTLKEEIHSQPLATERIVDLGIQLADALDAAHSAGILHRDIKPANIFITPRGEAKILDFGLAKLTARDPATETVTTIPGNGTPANSVDPSLTIDGDAPGTIGYMSPEQIRGEKLDGRTDVFSLGVVLYEMATGHTPFTGDTAREVCDNILHHEPTSVSQVNPDVPAQLQKIISKAVARDLNDRYPSTATLRDDLRLLKRASESASAIPVQSNAKKTWAIRALLTALSLLALWVAYLHFHHSQPASFTPRGSIVLADFTNTTGEPVFDDALKHALRAQLEQSPFLTVASDLNTSEQLRYMGRPADSLLTAEVAREVCMRMNSQAVLGGRISRFGSGYLIGLDAANCQNGQLLDSEQVEAKSRDEILPALAGTATRLRIKLGESIASVQKYDTPIEQVTTTSLEALQAYGVAMKMRFQDGNSAGIPYFTRATELDPNFAMAYVGLGVSYANLNLPEKARAAMEKAYQLRDRVSQRERFLIESHYYDIAREEYDKAIQTYRLWQQIYPEDLAPYVNLGTIYNFLGQHEQNLEQQQQALRLNPNLTNVYANLANAYLCLNQVDKAKEVLARVGTRNIDNPIFWQFRYEIAFLSGDPAQVERAFETFLSNGEDGALAFQADTEAYYGHLAKARELTERAVTLARRRGDEESAAGYQIVGALREADFGNLIEARKQVQAALKGGPDDHARILSALVFGRTGDRATALSIANKLSRQSPASTLVNAYWVPTILAAAELHRNPKKAIELLDAATPFELGLPQTPTNAVPYPIYIRGLAFLRLSDGERAAKEFRKIIEHPGIVGNYPLGALARLGLARAYALQASGSSGSKCGVRAIHCANRRELVPPEVVKNISGTYQDFLGLWKEADPELPLLKQAKKEWAVYSRL